MVNIRKPKSALKFSSPAGWWGALYREGLPTGNGIIGASVLGGAGYETVIINHGDLWWQGYTGVLPDVADKIKDVKKQIENGAPKAAENIIPGALVTKGYRPIASVPLPLCDFKVNMPLEKPVKEYMRVVNMENGEVSVSFRDGTTRFDRSCFVSRVHNIVAYEITRSGSKNIDVTFSLDMHDRNNNRTPSAVSKLPDGLQTKYEGYFMYYSGRSDNGTEFGAVARISHYGGSIQVTGEGIRIKGAEKVSVLIKPYVESQREKEWKNLKSELAAIKLTYDKLLKEHTSVHSKLFGAAELDLDATDRDEFMEVLLSRAQSTGDISDALLEKLWAYGRYLFICATGEASHVAAPYGLWCGDYKAVAPEIRSDGSLQTIYSHALAGGLSEFLLPVFTFYENVLDDLKKNAARLYGCRGIFVPAITAPNSGLLGVIDPKVVHFSGAAGWIGQLFYDYYLFTGDQKFLKTRALPFMKEVALFYEEFFKIKADGQYDTNPSFSPDSAPVTRTESDVNPEVARSSTADFAIAKELLTNLIKGSEIAGMNKADIEKWKDMVTRIPQYRFNTDGTVQEYIDTRFHDNLTTRHLLHVYPVYPGTEIFEREPELYKAYNQTAKKRLASAINNFNTAAFSRIASIFARLNEGDQALEILGYIVRTAVMNNMVTAANDWRGMGIGDTSQWAQYTIEGNLGITAAVQEMLVFSRDDVIKILPALPSAWKKGSMTGLSTRCGVQLDIDWDCKKSVITIKAKAKRAVTVDVYLPTGTKRYKGLKQEAFAPDSNLLRGVEFPAGKQVAMEIRL